MGPITGIPQIIRMAWLYDLAELVAVIVRIEIWSKYRLECTYLIPDGFKLKGPLAFLSS